MSIIIVLQRKEGIAEAAINITSETNLKKYMSLINNKNYIIIASANVDISKNIVLKDALAQLGLKPNA